MGLSQSFKRREELEALLIKIQEKRQLRALERIANGDNYEPPQSIEIQGFETARRWIHECPGDLTTLLQKSRQWANAEFYYTNPDKAPMAQAEFRRRKEFYRGAKKILERYFDEQGRHVPTQDELDREAIARILEMG